VLALTDLRIRRAARRRELGGGQVGAAWGSPITPVGRLTAWSRVLTEQQPEGFPSVKRLPTPKLTKTSGWGDAWVGVGLDFVEEDGTWRVPATMGRQAVAPGRDQDDRTKGRGAG